MIVGFDSSFINEFTGFFDHLYAQRRKALYRIIRGNFADHVMHMFMHAGKVDLWFDRCNTKGRRCAHGMGRMTGGQDRFRGHTAIIQTVTTHFAFFQQNGLGAQLCGPCGHRQATRTCAYNTNVCIDDIGHGFEPYDFLNFL